MKRLSLSNMLALSSSVLFAAQVNAAPPETSDSDPKEPAEIVVTGSRIERSSFDAPTPMTTVDSEAIQRSGFNNIGDVLTRVPSIGIGRGATSSQLTTEAGENFVNLRSLGTNRTLVLVNGRRRVSGSTLSSAVDLTTIPDSMVERVDVITGGASAVYGADAVTGVVNIILKKDFQGLEASANVGQSERGGADTKSLSILGGTRFADNKGSLTFGVSTSETDPLRWSQRRNLGPGLMELQPNPANTGPNDGIPDQIHYSNVRISNLSDAGSFVLGNSWYTFDPDVRPMQHDSEPFGPTAARAIGGDGWDWPDYDELRVGFKRVTANTYLNYEVAKNVNFYAEGEFTNSRTSNYIQPVFDQDLVIRRDNAFVSPNLGALMDANGITQFVLNRAHADQGIIEEDIDRNTFTVVSGFNGGFANGWTYDASYQYGRYNTGGVKEHGRIESRFRESVDSIIDPLTGSAVCRDVAARARGCVPVSLFGENAATPEAINYFRYDRKRDSTNTQQVVAANVGGELFALPHGPLQFSVGVEHRKETSEFTDDGLSITNQLWTFDNGGSNLKGEFDVDEAYLELLAPLLKDKPFIRELTLEAAVRQSDYSTIGSTTAWRFGGTWAPIDDLRFRVVRSRSVRAPNINELFSTSRKSLSFNDDPCDVGRIDLHPNRRANCAALGVPVGHVDLQQVGQDVITGGNPDLGPETSDSWSAGLVLTPASIAGFSASIDYWSIDITDAVSSLPSQTILERCVELDSIDNAFCPFVTRRADSQITSVSARIFNIGALQAEGIDFQSVYAFELERLFSTLPGQMRVAVNGTYLRKNVLQVDATRAGSDVIRAGRVTDPKWRGNLILSYANNLHIPFNVDWTFRVLGNARANVQLFSDEARDRNEASAYVYNDVTVGAEVKEGLRLVGGINNLFDKMPPSLAETYKGIGDGSLYDNIGRYYFVGATAKF